MTRTQYINNLIRESQESDAKFKLSQMKHKIRQDTFNHGFNIIMQQMSNNTLAALSIGLNRSI